MAVGREQQVIVEYRKAYDSDRAEALGRSWGFMAIVSARSQPDERGRVWKEVIEVRQAKKEAELKYWVRRVFADRVVEALDLSPVVEDMFA